MYINPPKVYGYNDIVVPLNSYNAGDQKAVSNTVLTRWAGGVEHAVNTTLDVVAIHHTELQNLRERVEKMYSWMQGAATFTEYVAMKYPEIIKEFNDVEKTKARVGAQDDYFTVIPTTQQEG